MNESLQLAKLFKFSCSNMDYTAIGLFPLDTNDDDILNFMSKNDNRIQDILSSEKIDVKNDVKIVTTSVSASPYCFTKLDQLPQDFYDSIILH